MKYILSAIGLLVGYVVSYNFFRFLEGLEYGNVTSAVLYDDYGVAIIIGCLAFGLIFMGIGHLLSKKKQQ